MARFLLCTVANSLLTNPEQALARRDGGRCRSRVWSGRRKARGTLQRARPRVPLALTTTARGHAQAELAAHCIRRPK
jgi:hypothetical protein